MNQTTCLLPARGAPEPLLLVKRSKYCSQAPSEGALYVSMSISRSKAVESVGYRAIILRVRSNYVCAYTTSRTGEGGFV